MDRHSSEDKDESTTEDEVRDSDGPRYLYRLCRQDEDPDTGLFARDPAATHVTPKSHVHGKRASPYISTCSTLEALRRYIGLAVNNGFRPGPVVRIDLARLRRSPGVEIIDLSNPDVVDREFLPTDARGRNYATRYNEVLVKGGIPADCIEVLEHVEESDEFDEDDYSSEYDEEDFEESSEGQGQGQRVAQDEHSNTDDDTMEDDHSSERTKRRKRQDEDKEDDDEAEGFATSERTSDQEEDSDEDTAREKIDCDEEEAASNVLEMLTNTFRESLETFIKKREETIRMLKELVELLNACRKTGNITKIIGAGVSIVGAGAALASVPLTGGMSILALAAGGICGVGGGVAGISGEIYTNSSERDLMARADNIMKDDQEEARKLEEAGTALQNYLKYMNRVGLGAKVTVGFIASSVAKTFLMRLLGIGSKASKAVGMARIAKGASAVLSVAFVPLDVWQIVSSANELSEDNSEKAKTVLKVIEDLEEDLHEKKETIG